MRASAEDASSSFSSVRPQGGRLVAAILPGAFLIFPFFLIAFSPLYDEAPLCNYRTGKKTWPGVAQALHQKIKAAESGSNSLI
jgi:hypothetical protein